MTAQKVAKSTVSAEVRKSTNVDRLVAMATFRPVGLASCRLNGLAY